MSELDKQIEAVKRGKSSRGKVQVAPAPPPSVVEVPAVKVERPVSKYDTMKYGELLKIARQRRIFNALNRPRMGLVYALRALDAKEKK